MPLPKYYPLPRESVLPSFFMERLQDFLSGVGTNLRVSLKSATSVQVVPDSELGLAAIALEGQWRFNEGTVSRAHPGGAKGTYVLWAVGTDIDVDNAPDPFTDHTAYAFDLRITSGADPAGAGVEVFEKIGEIDWDGAAIEALRQTHGAVTGQMIEDDALSSASGDIVWSREAGGALAGTLNEEAAIPAGTIVATARSAAPTGWLLCDGSAVSRITYKDLYEAIKASGYGNGDGATTFNVPDLRGRTAVGVDGAAARLTENDAQGQSGGEEKHKLTVAEMPSHAHDFSLETNAGANNTPAKGSTVPLGTGSTGSTGGGGSHNNMQPYQVVQYLIKI